MQVALGRYLDERRTAQQRANSYRIIKGLESRIRELYMTSARNLLKDSHIIVSTVSTSGCKFITDMLGELVDGKFDVCGIDECSQAHEGLCWIPLVLSKKAVLAGDHRQLKPIIRSREAQERVVDEGFASLFERMYEQCPESSIMLTI